MLGFRGGGDDGAGLEIVDAEERARRRSCSRCRPTAGRRWRSIGLRLLDRAKVFLRRAGTVILLVTVILWMMANVPTANGHPPAIAQSLAGTIGRTIEPVIKPLGFNWKIGIGLITSLAARETIIATLGTIYGMDPEAEATGSAGGAAAGPDARRRGRATGLFRVRDAVHLDDRRGAARDRRLEMADLPVHVHESRRVRQRIRRGARDPISRSAGAPHYRTRPIFSKGQ